MNSGNLPLQLTSFIGREREIAEVERLLAMTRLLTLTGSGGAGKTRLAIQAVSTLTTQYPDGVWFVDFAPLNDAVLVPQTVAAVFGLQEQSNRPIADTLLADLHEKHLLLLLDNCEHLIDACARFADDVLRAAPQVSILVTSREPLNIAGEMTFRAPSLAVPDVKNLPPLDSIKQADAVRLFVARASAVCSEFALTEQNARVVAQICHRLDGMPLALELAAARVRMLSVEEIAARLDDRFNLLTGGSRVALLRQQTLRATIDWSYDFLSEQERVLLRRLSVFAGGWTLAAAEQVCGLSTVHYPPSTGLDLLARLVDKSLVIADEQSGATRYRMLETIRQYASEKLSEANELLSLQARHCDFFVHLAETAESKLKGHAAKEWMDRLEMDYDNIRAVFDYALVNDVQTAARLAWSLLALWGRRGYLIEGRNVVLQLLAHPELQGANRWRLQALKTIGYLQIYIQDSTAIRTYFEESLAIAKLLEDESEIALTLRGMGQAFIFLNDCSRACWVIEASLALYRKIGNRWGEAMALYSLGMAFAELGDHQRGQRLLEESLEKFRAMGDICDSVLPINHLGRIARTLGDYARSTALYAECIEIDKRVNDQIHLANAMIGLGWTVLQQGDYQRATELYVEMLELLKRRGSPTLLTHWLNATADICREFDKPSAAAQLLGATNALVESLQVRGINFILNKMYERNFNAIRAELGTENFMQLWQAGRELNLDQAVAFALTEIKNPDLRKSTKAEFDGLTARERQVAGLIAQGKSNRDIASKLVLSERTVENHVGNILGKLEMHSRSQIAAWVVEKRLPKSKS